MKPLEVVREALERHGRKPKKNSNGYKSLCPAHDDHNPSLDIGEDGDGNALIHCKAGCGYKDVLEKIGLTVADLYPKTAHSEGHTATKEPPVIPESLKAFAEPRGLKLKTLETFKVELKTYNKRPALTYSTVLDIDRVKYLDGKKPKYGWTGKGIGGAHLYGVDKAKKGEPLYIVNGEPSVWACYEAGVSAVCICAGENTLPKKKDIKELKGFEEIRVVYDLDKAGRDGALKLLKLLREEGFKVKALKLPEYLGEGGDAGDLYQRKQERFKEILEDLPELSEPGAAIIRLGDIEAEEVSWLWEPYIPAGKVTILQGDPAAGKTFMAIDLCARLTREGKTVLFGTLEDGLKDTIKRRADMQKAVYGERFKIFEGETDTDGKTHFTTLERPDVIEDAIKKCKPELLVLDPISAWLGGTADINRANQVRAKLAPLVRLAETYGVAVLVIQHLTKSRADKAIYRGSGSIDFVATARSVLIVGKASDDSQALCQVKNSLGPLGPSLGFIIDAEGFHWTGEVDLTANDILGAEQDPEEKSATEEAMTWLEAELSEGPQQAGDLQRRFEKETGNNRQTLRRALKKIGGIRSKNGFKGSWTWSLSEGDIQDTKVTSKRERVTFDESTVSKGLQGGFSTEGDIQEGVCNLRGDLAEDAKVTNKEYLVTFDKKNALKGLRGGHPTEGDIQEKSCNLREDLVTFVKKEETEEKTEEETEEEWKVRMIKMGQKLEPSLFKT